MTGIGVLLADTLREASRRKVFWGLYGLSTAMVLFFLFLLRIDLVEGARATVSLLGLGDSRTLPLTRVVRNFYSAVASFLYTYGMALAVFASAGLMSAVWEQGRIEWLLSKPVARWRILLARLMGSLLVVAFNICYLVASVWLIMGWKSGIWDATFLITIPAAVFMFAVLLSVVALVAVLSESTALATMVTFALMLASPVLAQHRLMVKLLNSELWRDLWRGLYYIVPKVYDVGRMNVNLIRDRAVENWMPLWSSALFAAVLLAASFFALSKRDF